MGIRGIHHLEGIWGNKYRPPKASKLGSGKPGKSRHLDWKFPMAGKEKKVLFRMFSPIFAYCLSLLGQWLNFKLFGITYLVGKISRSNVYFKVHWQSELYIRMILLSSQLQAQTSLQRCLPFASWSAPGGSWGVSFEKAMPLDQANWWFQICLFSSRTLGKIPIFTHIFRMGWKHQLASVWSNIWGCLQISHQKKTANQLEIPIIILETTTTMEIILSPMKPLDLKGSYLMKSCEKAINTHLGVLPEIELET